MDVASALGEVVAALPAGGEPRPGQHAMGAAIDDAIATGRHVVVR